MRNPLLSILIPVYNQRHLIRNLCDNISRYPSDEVEVLIQDDFSTDDTYLELLSHSKSIKNARIFRNSTNLGARENVSSLLKKATGSVVLFSAGDDFALPGGVDSVLNRIRTGSHSDVEIRLCWKTAEPFHRWQSIDFSGIPPEAKKDLLNSKSVYRKLTPAEFFFLSATIPGFVWMQGASIKVELACRAGFLPEGGVDDWGLLHNIAERSLSETISVAVFDEILSVIGVSPNSLGSNALAQLERQLYVVDRYWNSQFKKAALLNLLEKKISQFRQTDHSYSEIVNHLLKGLSGNSTG
jgi:glycosyltransferase involved in cell wall biosynthesis